MSEFGMSSEGNRSANTADADQTSANANNPESPAGGVGDQVQEAAGQVQEQAIHLMDMARGQVTSQLAAQKDAAAGGLGTLAEILRSTSGQIREQDQASVATYVDSAADRVEHLAETLRTQDVDQLIATTSQFARREPALFLASAFALGFAGIRFFRSSSPAANAAGNGSAGMPSPVSGQSGFSGGSGASARQQPTTAGNFGAYDRPNTYDSNPAMFDTAPDLDLPGSIEGPGSAFGATWDPIIDPIEHVGPR